MKRLLLFSAVIAATPLFIRRLSKEPTEQERIDKLFSL
jgi:hypothetical protein